MAIGAGLLLTFGYLVITGDGEFRGPGLLTALVLMAWTAIAFRAWRTGLFSSAAGIRNRSVLRTRTVSWHDINRFETRLMTKGIGSAYAKLLRAHVICLVLADGSVLETSFVHQARKDLLPDSGAKAAVINAQLAFAERTGLVTSEVRAQEALRELRETHKSATSGIVPPV
ncbi:hypothetical protein AOZ06_07305 [Kibdelosporangium phytohabitans]|uniref:Uncharacterized protein n=2 Tax=Kibdelosporangium phytohabitans TaxID=860235 RepID=A0A0N7F2T9_9PSEU|nr:hypothetical protein AOZ06_07305 [Kibdelosporangium phytohabitans]